MLALTTSINPYVLLTFVGLLLVLIYRYMRATYSVMQKLGIPCPKSIWVFGNAHEMKDKNPLDVFQEWQKMYGDVYGFYEGFRAGVVCHGTEMAHEILSKNFENFHARPSYRPFRYYPDDMQLNNIAGDHWKSQRAVINKALNHSGTFNQIFETVDGLSDRLEEEIEKERTLHPDGFDIAPMMGKFTSNTMASFLLGMDDEDLRCHGDALHEFEIEYNKAASPEYEHVGLAMLFPSLAPFFKLFNTKHQQCHNKVVEILKKYITDTAAGHNNNDIKHHEHPSLLSLLLSATVQSRDIDGSLTRRKLTDDELLAHLFTLLSETFTTSSAMMSFLLYELARNPQVQDRLYEEICQVCNKDNEIDMSAVQSMEYFDQVFNETYRMHPIAPGLQRECATDCTVRGFNFKQGMVVRVMTCSMYNDESLFPNPQKFEPERFSQQNKESRPKYSFLPFGLGPRGCPGQKLVPFSMKLTLIHILTRYRVATTDKTEIPMKHAFRPSLVPKNGVHIKLEPRC